jgi:hypothetical protein
MPGKVGEVAPLRQWPHDRTMHIGTCLFVQATPARLKRVTHQESGDVGPSILRRYNISLQRPGEAQHVARTRHAGGNQACALIARRPAAELGR